MYIQDRPPLFDFVDVLPRVTMLHDTASVSVHSVEAVEWMVRGFVMIHSLINANQPYTVLKRWQLG